MERSRIKKCYWAIKDAGQLHCYITSAHFRTYIMWRWNCCPLYNLHHNSSFDDPASFFYPPQTARVFVFSLLNFCQQFLWKLSYFTISCVLAQSFSSCKMFTTITCRGTNCIKYDKLYSKKLTEWYNTTG